jgi:hypothetical protein
MAHPSGQTQTVMELLPLERLEPLHTKFETGGYKPYIGPFPEGIVHDRFVLVDSNGAGRVDDISACSRVWGDRVECAEDELFLEVREELEVALSLKVSCRSTYSDCKDLPC